MRTKCRRLPDVCGDAFGAHGDGPAWALEACLENTSKTSLVFRDVRLDPPEGAVVARVGNDAGVIGDAAAALGAALVLAPGESAHVLHVVRRAAGASTEGAASLGKLDVRWRGADGGESGRLQTQAVLTGAPAPAPAADGVAASSQWSLVAAAVDVPRILPASDARPVVAQGDASGIAVPARVGVPFVVHRELHGPPHTAPPDTWRIVHLATAGAAAGARVPPASFSPDAARAASSSGLRLVGSSPSPLSPLTAVTGTSSALSLTLVALRAGALRLAGVCVVAPDVAGLPLRVGGGRVVCALVPLELRVL